MTALYNFNLIISLDIFWQRYAFLFSVFDKNSAQQRTVLKIEKLPKSLTKSSFVLLATRHPTFPLNLLYLMGDATLRR